jgi:hypothetical protein
MPTGAANTATARIALKLPTLNLLASNLLAALIFSLPSLGLTIQRRDWLQPSLFGTILADAAGVKGRLRAAGAIQTIIKRKFPLRTCTERLETVPSISPS